MFGIFKKKETEVINKEIIFSTVNYLHSLLKANNFDYYAKAFEISMEHLQNENIDAFSKSISSGKIWGKDGAWEAGGFPSERLEREYLVNLRTLLEVLAQNNIRVNNGKRISKFLLNLIEEKD